MEKLKHKLEFQWDIKDFKDCNLNFNEYFESPRFSVTTDPAFKSDWKLLLFPDGFNECYALNDNIYLPNYNLSVLLMRLDSESVFNVKCSISFLKKERIIETVTYSNKFEKSSIFMHKPREPKWHKNSFKIKNYSENFLENGNLTILCEIEIFGKMEVTELAHVKNSFLRGTSVIKNTHQSIKVDVETTTPDCFDTNFYFPYGNIELQMKLFADKKYEGTFIQLIGEDHPEIKACFVDVVLDKQILSAYVTRGDPYRMQFKVKPPTLKYSVKLRCLIETEPEAYSYESIATFKRKILDNFRKKILQPHFGDIFINVDGKTLRAHKDILAYYSPVFAEMIKNTLDQSTPVLNINDFKITTVLAMLEYIYAGAANEYQKGAPDSFELLHAAERYELVGLQNVLTKILLNGSNIWFAFNEKQESFRKNFVQPQFGDICLEVEGRFIYAHKDILGCHSPVFATMFNETWFEGGFHIIDIPDFGFSTILTMIEQIYFCDRDLKTEDPVNLLQAADMYQLDLLKRKCEQCLCSILNKSNIKSFLELSDTYDLICLKNAARYCPCGSQYMNC